MIISTKGIAINTINYSETSVIARIFTQQLGIQSYIINGVRKSKSKNKSAIFQPLTLLDLVVYHNEKSNLHHIKEIKIETPYFSLHTDVRKSCVVLFLSEILYKSIREHEKNNELFEFIKQMLLSFDKEDELIPVFHIFFLSRLTKFLGFNPNLNYSVLNAFFNPIEGQFQATKSSNMFDKEVSLLFLKIFEESEHHLSNFNKRERTLLLDSLVYYFGAHIHTCNNIQSLEILKVIFE